MKCINGKTISDFCIGTGDLEVNYKEDYQTIISRFEKFIELGFNFFDTGSVYDNLRSIKILSKLYKTNTGKIFLNNKFHPRCSSQKDIINDTENVLKLLNIDCIDMLQSHWPNLKLPIEEIIEAFMNLKKEGKIRFCGLSNPYKNILNNQSILSNIDSLQLETNIYENSLDLDFNKLVLGYSVLRYLKKELNNDISFLDHFSYLSLKGITPIIRTLDINKISSLINLKQKKLNNNKLKLLNNLYKKKIIKISINKILFSKNINTYKNIDEAILNTLGHNPSPIEISNEIKMGNIIKPIKVKLLDNSYVIEDGVNRLWAYKILSVKNLDCVVIK